MKPLVEKIYDEIEQVLMHHRLSRWQCDDGESNYPLTDMLTPDGETIQAGYDEIRNICDAIYNEVLTKHLPGSHEELMKFYSVDNITALIAAQEAHIAKLQAKVPAIPDQFPASPRHG